MSLNNRTKKVRTATNEKDFKNSTLNAISRAFCTLIIANWRIKTK
jgi:hypothetical protein